MTKIKKSPNTVAPPSIDKTVRVFYSDKQKGHDQFFVYAHEDMIHKWRKGTHALMPHNIDKTIPLVDVVDSFEIFDVTNGGATGKAVRPTLSALSNTFQTSDINEIIPKILETGKIMNITAKSRNDVIKENV